MADSGIVPPWRVLDIGSAFVVEDANGRRLAYIYCEKEAGRRSLAGLLTREEAQLIADAIANLPDLLSAQATE